LGDDLLIAIQADFVQQHEINIFDPATYDALVKNASVGIFAP
jgi:hypothetical protein